MRKPSTIATVMYTRVFTTSNVPSLFSLCSHSLLFVLGISFFSLLPLLGAASEKSSENRLCKLYMDEFEDANKEMASINAESYGDDSAPRETNRQLKILNQRTIQLIVILQSQAHQCPVPKMISSGLGYVLEANKCRRQQLKGIDGSPECDQTKWESVFSNAKEFRE